MPPAATHIQFQQVWANHLRYYHIFLPVGKGLLQHFHKKYFVASKKIKNGDDDLHQDKNDKLLGSEIH